MVERLGGNVVGCSIFVCGFCLEVLGFVVDRMC